MTEMHKIKSQNTVSMSHTHQKNIGIGCKFVTVKQFLLLTLTVKKSDCVRKYRSCTIGSAL